MQKPPRSFINPVPDWQVAISRCTNLRSSGLMRWMTSSTSKVVISCSITRIMVIGASLKTSFINPQVTRSGSALPHLALDMAMARPLEKVMVGSRVPGTDRLSRTSDREIRPQPLHDSLRGWQVQDRSQYTTGGSAAHATYSYPHIHQDYTDKPNLGSQHTE